MADTHPDLLQRSMPDGMVPAEVVARTERRWLGVMVAMLIVMMAVVVLTGMTHAISPPSNVETIDPTTLHLGGEFAESNLGTAQERDGSLTVRLIGGQFGFAPDCTKAAVDTPVKFRLTSTDVIHGFLLPSTNVNTMVVPGFVAQVHSEFTRTGDLLMPCHEYCGLGHSEMWATVQVLRDEEFRPGPDGRVSCAQR